MHLINHNYKQTVYKKNINKSEVQLNTINLRKRLQKTDTTITKRKSTFVSTIDYMSQNGNYNYKWKE